VKRVWAWGLTPWRPRSWAFLAIDMGLAWIGITFGMNLVFSDKYRGYATSQAIASIEQMASLEVWGWAFIVGAALLVLGVAGRWPLLAVLGHVAQSMLTILFGLAVFKVDPLNQTALVIGVVLHPVMAVTLAFDSGTAQARSAVKNRE
jgi:hypothetical protein